MSEPGTDALTPRELDVARYLALGHTYREISAALGLTFHTVNSYAKQIRQKLGLRNRTEIARWAMRHKLIGNDP